MHAIIFTMRIINNIILIILFYDIKLSIIFISRFRPGVRLWTAIVPNIEAWMHCLKWSIAAPRWATSAKWDFTRSFQFFKIPRVPLWYQIEVRFPDSCLNPFFLDEDGRSVKAFHWNDFVRSAKSRMKSISDFLPHAEILSSANKAQQHPGQPFYFRCGAKHYMAIMQQVSNILNLFCIKSISY